MHVIPRGLDLPIAGAPDLRIASGPAITRVALLGADFHGLRPALRVQPGDAVRRGDPVFDDKKLPGVRHTAPAGGRVVAVHRGEKRAFESLVIEVGPEDATQHAAFASWQGPETARAGGEALRALLLESGLWTALRTRPYSRVPSPQAVPSAIFVTALDTRPLAAPVDVALAGREADFAAGVLALRELTPGPVYVCRAAGSRLPVPAADRVSAEDFSGPHPAGNAGTHIHFLHPVGPHRSVWHIGAQDVAALGRLLATGRLDVERVVALAGGGAIRAGHPVGRALHDAEVMRSHRMIADKVVLPPEATSCAIPAGVFEGVDGAVVQTIAYGEELNLVHPPRPADPKVAWEQVWTAKVRVKSTGMVPLGMGDADESPRRGARTPGAAGQPPSPAPKESKPPNPVDDAVDAVKSLKGIFKF